MSTHNIHVHFFVEMMYEKLAQDYIIYSSLTSPMVYA